MIQDPFILFTALMGVILLSLKLIEAVPVTGKLSAVLWILFFGAVASNTGLIASESPLYGQVVNYVVPIAVCLVLFRVRLRDIARAGMPMIVAFGIASIGTMVGVLISGLIFEPFLNDILGASSWKLAGPYTGTYIGGSLNFFALWDGLKIGNPDLFAAANAVDNLTIFPLFAIWMLVPALLGKRFPVSPRWHMPVNNEANAHDSKLSHLRVNHLVSLLFIALVVLAFSNWIKAALIDPILPQVPSILIVTTLALILGQVPFISRLEGSKELSNFAFYLFFAAVGAMINLYNAVVLSPILFVYVMVIIAVHMVIIYGAGRLLKLDVAVLTVASVAAKAGPPTVLAIAEVKEWGSLALPGVLMGLLGYAIGNYAGFATAYAMKALLGL